MKTRLDVEILRRKLAFSRSQAEDLIKRGQVKLNKKIVQKSATPTSVNDEIEVIQSVQYVSRAALKLASVANKFGLDFKGKTVLDVGSSTGGFTQYVLLDGARKVVAVEVGTNQLHPLLQGDKRIELHEQTDIRDFKTNELIDIVVADVSFISLREILPHISTIIPQFSLLAIMVKPQFEAGRGQVNKGVIKNDKVRREILKDFEVWAQKYFVILDKADSEVAGAKGNLERFYLLKKL